jgi:hypothetical protein
MTELFNHLLIALSSGATLHPSIASIYILHPIETRQLINTSPDLDTEFFCAVSQSTDPLQM